MAQRLSSDFAGSDCTAVLLVLSGAVLDWMEWVKLLPALQRIEVYYQRWWLRRCHSVRLTSS